VNDRGRVPFALIGVLLVVTSTTIVATTNVHPPRISPDIDEAMEGATAATIGELRGAADEAATEAAIAPVTEPSDTPIGQALRRGKPFEDALRLRIHVRAAQRLDNVRATRGDVSVAASLPRVEPTTEGYRNAIERVEIERGGADDAALRVSIEGVRLSATRDGDPVMTVERTPEFVVANPALVLHDRTERFEARANAPVTERGLGRRLTTRLYPIAWTRGYAQHGGAPIATVLGTRHVELATNDALLAEQRAIFGEADPGGHRGVGAAGRRVATTDLIAGVGGKEKWTDAVLGGADEIGPGSSPEQPVGAWRDARDDPTITVGINNSADHAFASVVGATGADTLGKITERTHAVETRVEASKVRLRRTVRSDGSPGGDWKHVSSRSDETIELDRIGNRAASVAGWHLQGGATYRVKVIKTTNHAWTRENETTRTETVDERVHRVTIAARARTKPIENVPDGRLDEHLEEATNRATDRAIATTGGFDGAARTAARGGTVHATATATASPANDRSTFEAELGALRDQTREISVALPAPAVGTGRSNPASQLRSALDERRGHVTLDADRSATERTIRAAQLAYLDALESELSRRESTFDDAGNGISDAVGEYLGHDRLDGALTSHGAPSSTTAERLVDPAGSLALAVDTAPSYLTTNEVHRDRIDEPGGGTVHPLSTRTVNVFTSPHGQVASGIFDLIPFLGTERVQLSTAARTLRALDSDDPKHDRLESDVERATSHVRGELVAEMVDAGVSRHEASTALRTDRSVANDALALVNGTTMERAARSVDRATETDRLESRLRTRLDAELETTAARPAESTTTDAQRAAREKYSTELDELLADGIETGSERARKQALGERLGALPAGLPLAPVPGYWYATANVWYVNVTGQYERFAVRTNRGDGTAATTYLRDGRAVELVHQGEARHLGRADRVSVQTRTAVVVVVPPGPRGVGNTDGEIDKRSPGWPS
jgi:hypothetical protein